MSKSTSDFVRPAIQKIENATTQEELDKVFNPQVVKAFRENKLVDEADAIQEAYNQRKIILAGNSTLQTEGWLKRFITQDSDMIKVKEIVRKLSKVNDPVLIQGETGTGKELLARALHGDRKGKFIAINCAGLPDYLIESELFGHVKGAFTDAKEAKTGLMKAAAEGTFFLDEIGELKYSLQAKMLRAIQEKKIRRVGANDEETISCRFVAATHHNLFNLTKTREFREDLYHRLSVFSVNTKPIRDRQGDIALIIDSLCADEKKKLPINGLEKLHLNGNVRELEKMVRRFVVLDELPSIPNE